MLVLSRHKNETVVIDPTTCPRDELGRIVLTIVELRGDKVRVGIQANRKVSVHRGEVQEAIDRAPAPLAAYVPLAPTG